MILKLTRLLRAALAALLLAATLAPAALADEGMWAFNNLPRAEIKRRYGFEVTDDWVRRVQSATVRFPNGTGSFVSPEGLVLTNYHIVEDIVGKLSTAERDLAKTGFVAHTRAEELKIPGLALDQLVRIVFAPEFQAAFFGGDPDNFNFPRYNLDMALVRVYEGGAPLRAENYFRWSKKGPQEGELTFVSGSPGTTQRLNTVAHLEYLRDTGVPLIVRTLESRRDSLRKYMAGGEEQTRRGQNELNYAENFVKVYGGQLEGLKGRELMARKLADEQALRKYVSADARRRG